VNSANDLRLMISGMAPGTTANLTIWRDNRTEDVKVTLTELETQNAQAGQSEGNGSGTMAGVRVQALTPDMTQDLGVPSGTHGVVITSVDPSSPAAAAGLDRGVVIQEVNHKPVTNTEEYNAAVSAAGDRPVLLLIMIPNSDGAQNYVVVEPH
jgi:serine protease Do